MLTLLWLMLFCYAASAREPQEVLADEILRIFEHVKAGKPLHEFYTRNPDEVASEEYPRESSTEQPEEHWPSPPPQHPEEHLPSPPTEYTPVDHSDGQPGECDDYGCSEHPYEEHKPGYPIQVGSIRGIPGINFPDYKDIPITQFICSDKVYIPGFYADMETGCQVFHVCWPHRRESFLCPIGTIFNQAILACDFWYSSNCSLASHYYDVNSDSFSSHTDADFKKGPSLGTMVDALLGESYSESVITSSESPSSSVSKESLDLSQILRFLPVKSKVFVYPVNAESFPKIVEVSVGKIKKSHGFKHVSQKSRIYEEVQTEDIAVSPKSTAVPLEPHEVDTVQKVLALGVNKQYIDLIIDQILDIAKKLSKPEGLFPMPEKVFQKIKLHKGRKNLHKTKLNPKFITKPVEVPKQHGIEHQPNIQHSTKFPKVQKAHLHSRPQIKVGSSTKKHAGSGFKNHVNILPSTKKVLAESFLKMIKMRSSGM